MQFFRFNHSLGIFFATLVVGCAGGQVAPGGPPGAAGNQLGSGNNAVGITMDSGVPANQTWNTDTYEMFDTQTKREATPIQDTDTLAVKISGTVTCYANESPKPCPSNRVLRILTCSENRFVDLKLETGGPTPHPFEVSFVGHCQDPKIHIFLARQPNFPTDVEFGVERLCPGGEVCSLLLSDWMFPIPHEEGKIDEEKKFIEQFNVNLPVNTIIGNPPKKEETPPNPGVFDFNFDKKLLE